LPGDDIQVFLGADRLTRVNGAPGTGEFQVVSNVQIRFELPAGVVAGTILPFRLIIRGAESSPGWITA
jgi:hypothetical protein